eukprot:246343_1
MSTAPDVPDVDEYEVKITERPVGVRLIHTDKIVVDQVLDTGFGAQLGIQKGDILIQINGTSIIELENDEAIKLFNETELPFNATFSKSTQNSQSSNENDDIKQEVLQTSANEPVDNQITDATENKNTFDNNDDNKNEMDSIQQKQNIINNNRPILQDLSEWNIIDVLMWFIDYGRNKFSDENRFSKYQEIIWNNKINGAKLKTLTQIDLYNIGINNTNDCYDLYIGICDKLGIDINENTKALTDEDIKEYMSDEKQEPDVTLSIFNSNKYNYSDRGRFIWIEECLSLGRICFILCKYVLWINECNEIKRLLKYKENVFSNEKLLMDICLYEKDINMIMN